MTKKELEKQKELEEHEEKVKKLNPKETKIEELESDDILEDEDDDLIEDVIKLNMSKEINGSREITLDFTKVTGFFLEMCRKQYKLIKTVKKEVVNIESLDDKYYIIVASKLLKIHYDIIMKLPYKDYKKILDKVKGYLQQG